MPFSQHGQFFDLPFSKINPTKVTRIISEPMSTRIKSSRNRLFRKRRAVARRAAAAVEAAICFPLIVLLMMGTLEICAGIYLKESVSICAFEGCRVGVRRRATREMVLDRINEALADRQVVLPMDASGETQGIEVIPEDFSTLRELDTITVRITAPTQGNSLYIFDSLVNRNVVSQCTMVREFNE